MGQVRTLGGDRLGSGNRMKVAMNGYERSNNDMGYLWRSTMSAGTLVPFLKLVAQPGDTFEIHLGCDVKTHPTIGPLFGSAKVQLDLFTIPMRLYNSLLHNNKIKIGLTMNKVYFPVVEFNTPQQDLTDVDDIDNCQINPSCIWSYLGVRGVWNNDADPTYTRTFNATALLCYWDIYKNYYANKMEEIGMVIHNGVNAGGAILSINILDAGGNWQGLPLLSGVYMGNAAAEIDIEWTTATAPNLEYILFQINTGSQTIWVPALELFTNWIETPNDHWNGKFNVTKWGQVTIYDWKVAGNTDSIMVAPTPTSFPLENIDEMREAILQFQSLSAPYNITSFGQAPYSYVAKNPATPNTDLLASQEGLALKTYQSDLFNNWLNTEYIDGPDGINEITKIDTTGNEFTIDALLISKKVYDYLNRVAVSGGSFRDWSEVTYDHDIYWIPEGPVYQGGLIKELVFQEVISNSQSEGQPLATLAGRGVMSNKHKGGHVIIKVDEPSYVMGIVSITPRIDYSQGNDWDMYALETFDDLHKPALDEIGFQDLIQEQLAWWSTHASGGGGTAGDAIQKSAGKQPSWMNYRTSVNKVLGNFAIPTNEMFMVFTRRYEYDDLNDQILDMTTYIDPTKFNHIFAETSLDAQNFWVNIAVDIEARRKISARLMPNL